MSEFKFFSPCSLTLPRTFWKEVGRIASKGSPTVADSRATQMDRAGPDLNKEHDVKCPSGEA